MIGIIIFIIIAALWFHFEPKFEKVEQGWIVWYNVYGRKSDERTYKKIGWKK